MAKRYYTFSLHLSKEQYELLDTLSNAWGISKGALARHFMNVGMKPILDASDDEMERLKNSPMGWCALGVK